MTTPRRLSASAGSVWAMAAAPIRIRLNVPIRLMSMTLRYDARSCGGPARPPVPRGPADPGAAHHGPQRRPGGHGRLHGRGDRVLVGDVRLDEQAAGLGGD